MTASDFADFMDSIGIDLENFAQYFRAFDVNGSGVITLSDFVLGLVALDKRTPNHRFRIDYIYRFYCENKTLMTSLECQRMLDDMILKGRKNEADVNPSLKHFNGDFTLKKFRRLVGSLTLRHTSSLFRANLDGLLKSIMHDEVPLKDEPLLSSSNDAVNEAGGSLSSVSSSSSYEFAHTKFIFSDWRLLVPDVNLSDMKTASARLHSTTPSECAMEILVALKFFEVQDISAKNSKRPYSWSSVTLDSLVADFLVVCRSVGKTMLRESTCLKLKSPVFVFGNLRGNFSFASELISHLFPLGVNMSPYAVCVFGEFIGDTDCNFELLFLLFALKSLYPQKVFLLNGVSDLSDEHDSYLNKSIVDDKESESCGTTTSTKLDLCLDAVYKAFVDADFTHLIVSDDPTDDEKSCSKEEVVNVYVSVVGESTEAQICRVADNVVNLILFCFTPYPHCKEML
ncbi:unnamed protein product [Soboliphyme baturini]|uniref:EF-hand domain-containing protein n=1 Tax=Soboliphyme baturini TaxID=241478 RepID=A0A183IGU6_9BILA|nr:unnamed protein product [Soboliphyme baturini]